MHTRKIALFDCKPHDREYFSQANSNFGFDITYFESRLTQDTIKLADGYATICLFVHDACTNHMLQQLKSLGVRLIALRSNGYNHIDVAAAQKYHLPITRVPKYSPFAIAEYTLGLILSLNRKIHQAYWKTKMNNFSLHGLKGFDMKDKTCGIVGAGQIGSIVIRLLHAFQVRCLVYDPFLPSSLQDDLTHRYGCSFVQNKEELFSQSDIITLHCQLTSENNYLINTTTLSNMKRGVYIINTSRGGLIDTEALIENLKTGHVGACALDVYEEEDKFFFEDFSATFIEDDLLARLLTFPNVIVSSHQAFFTHEALYEIAHTTLENINCYHSQGILQNGV